MAAGRKGCLQDPLGQQAVIDQSTARHLAIEYLDRAFPETAGQWDILDGDTVEASDGWIFYWNSTEYVRTRDADLLCYGAVPLWVSRTGAQIELRPELDEG